LRLWLATLPVDITMADAKDLLRMTRGNGYVVWMENSSTPLREDHGFWVY
jgi:hypothetical protein